MNTIKPSFPDSGMFSEETMMKFSVEELEEMQKAEKESQGTFYWYLYPSNIHSLIDYCIKAKKDE